MDKEVLHILELLFSKTVEQKTVRTVKKDIERLSHESRVKLELEAVQKLKQLLKDDPVTALSLVSLFYDGSHVLQQCLKGCVMEILSSCLTGLHANQMSSHGTSKFHFASKAVYGVLQSICTEKCTYDSNSMVISQLKQVFEALANAIIDDNLPSDSALITATSLCMLFTYFTKGNMAVQFLRFLKIMENHERQQHQSVTQTFEELFECKYNKDTLKEGQEEDTTFDYEDIETSYPAVLIIHGLLNSGVSWIYSVQFSDSGLSPDHENNREYLQSEAFDMKLRTKDSQEEATLKISDPIDASVESAVPDKSLSEGQRYDASIVKTDPFCEKDVLDRKSAFLYSLYPLITKLCRASSSYAFQAFQMLHAWLSIVRKLLKNLQKCSAGSSYQSYIDIYPSKVRIFAIHSEFSDNVFHLLNSNWENPTKGVSDIVYTCMMELLQLHEDETPGQAKIKAMHMVSALVSANAWSLKSTYPPLALAISYAGAETVLQNHPSLPNGLMKSLTVNYLAPAGTNVYKIILNNLTSCLWSKYFLTLVLEALHSSDRMSRQNVLMLWLPVTVRQYPDIYVDLLSNCQTSSEGWIARMAILRVARTCGIVKLAESIESIAVGKNNHCMAATGEDNEGNKERMSLSVMAILQFAVSHIDETVRSEALAFLCHTKKASQPVSLEEARLIKEFFALNMNIDSAPFRQNIIKCYKALVIRFRDACATVLKTSYKNAFHKDGIQSCAFKDLSTNSALYINGDLLVWFLRIFHLNLKPGGNYQRRILSLQLNKETLLAFSEVDQNSEYIVNQRFLPVCVFVSYFAQNYVTDDENISQPIVDLTLPWTLEMLLSCCLDDMNDIREEAEITFKILEFSRVKQRRSETEKWLHLGLALCNSPKASDIESGASIVKIITSTSYGCDSDITALLQDIGILGGHKDFLDFLYNRVETQFKAAQKNLLVASRNAPIHGSLLALGRCLCEIESRTPAHPERIQELLKKLLELLVDIVEFMLSALAVSSQNGSSIAPSFAEMGESIEMIIKKCEDSEECKMPFHKEKTGLNSSIDGHDNLCKFTDDDADESFDAETAISGDHALVLACCWQTMKVCCLVVSMCASRWLSILSEGQVERLLRSVIIRVLTGTRHKGAMEAARLCYGQLSTLLLSTGSGFGHLVYKQVDDVLTQLKSGAQTSITRRAAGMAMMVQVACGAVPRTNKQLIDSTVSRLMDIAQSEYEEQSMVDSPPVLALHILHSLVIHASLAHHLVQHMPAITIICLEAFASSSWALRNAALQLYGAVVPRMVGQKKVRDDSSVHNSLTACEFISRHPELAEYILKLLKNVNAVEDLPVKVDNSNGCMASLTGENLAGLSTKGQQNLTLKTSSHLVPVLSLLARLSPGTGLQQSQELHERLSNYSYITSQLLGSPIHTVRRLASLSVVALTPTEHAARMVSTLTKSLENQQLSTNVQHGTLHTIRNFLGTYPKLLGDDILKERLCLILNRFTEPVKCFINATLALKVLQLYQVAAIKSDLTLLDACQPGAAQYLQTRVKLQIKLFSEGEMEKYLTEDIFTRQSIEEHFQKYLEDHLSNCMNSAWMKKIEKIICQKLEEIDRLPSASLIRILCVIINKQNSMLSVPSEKALANLLSLLQGYHGAKISSKTLIIIAYIIKDFHNEQWSEVKNKAEFVSAFSSIISSYSNPSSTEDYRLAATKALRITIGSLLFSYENTDAVTKEQIVVACIKLLQDEDAFIRDSACHIVFQLQSSTIDRLSEFKCQFSEAVHPNLAARYFIEIILKSCIHRKDWTTLRVIWRLSFLNDNYAYEYKPKLYLFQSHTLNLYEEPKHLGLYIAETFEKVMKDYVEMRKNITGDITEPSIGEWLQHECEVMNRQGSFLKTKVIDHQNILTEKRVLTAVSMHVVAYQALKSVCNVLGILPDLSCPLSWEPSKFCGVKVS